MTVSPAQRAARLSSPRRPILHRLRLFAGPAGQPRARRATDVIVLLSAGVGVALLGAAAVPQPGIERRFVSFLQTIPSGLTGLWRLMIATLLVLSVVLILACGYRRRWATLRDLAVASGLALGLSLVVGRLVIGSWPSVWDSLRSIGGRQYFPPLGLAVSSAIVICALPDLHKPVRRLGRWSIVVAFIGNVLHLTATPIAATCALLVAAASAAAVHLTFGSSMGRPSLDDVATALTGLGVPAHSLHTVSRPEFSSSTRPTSTATRSW
jgi:hypothetical protein